MQRNIQRPIATSVTRPVLLNSGSTILPPLPNGSSTVVARGSNYFNGTTDYYAVTDAANLDYANADWAVCALVKITRLHASLTQHIFNHGNTGAAQNARLYLANGVLTGIHRNATASITATGATLTADNVNGWFIVGMRRNGTNLEVFSAPVGGTVTVGTPVAINTPAAVTPSGNFFIGCRWDQAANNFLNNHLSYLFKLDGTLSNADINNLAAGQDIITNLAKSPSLYAKFDTSAATITDSGTGANVITRFGTPQARGCYAFTGLPVAINTSTHGVDTVYARVFQRAAGTTSKTLTFTGTYTGSPAGIEARVISSTGAQVVAWTRATTPTAGTWSVTLPNVPQGGQYALEVRHTNNVANIQRTQLPWGVGIIFVSAGESLEDQRSVGASGTAGTDFTANSEMISAWQQSSGTYKSLRDASPASVVVHSLARLSLALGIPVAHYNGATSGTTLLPNSGNTWSVAGAAVHTAFASALANAGGDAEAISVRLGSNDSNNALQRTEAEWAAQFPTMVSLLRVNFTRTAAQLPVFASETARNDAISSANDNNFRAVRNAQQATIPNVTNCFTQGASHSLTHDDDLHPSGSVSGYWRFEKMFAQAVLNYLDNVTYSTGLRGAEPTGAVINGSTIDISYTLNNGSTLQGLTGATGLTGFIVYGAAVSMTAVETTLTVSSITKSGTTATATTSAAHGLSVGQPVFISGATGSYYNGQKIVATTPTATTFTYTINTLATASASGTLRAAYATATATAHGLATNDRIGVFGATTNEYNMADAAVFVVDANTFRYGVHQQAATPATGTITFRKHIPITTTAIPTATMVRLTPSVTPVTGWLVDYVGGQNPVITNMLYTNASVIGDTAGVPARAWTAAITL